MSSVLQLLLCIPNLCVPRWWPQVKARDRRFQTYFDWDPNDITLGVVSISSLLVCISKHWGGHTYNMTLRFSPYFCLYLQLEWRVHLGWLSPKEMQPLSQGDSHRIWCRTPRLQACVFFTNPMPDTQTWETGSSELHLDQLIGIL